MRPRMLRRALTALLSSVLLLAMTATTAFAQAAEHDNGEGLLGETTDRMVTFFSLGVVVFFAAFVVLMSLIQHKLEKRHHEDRGARQRIGW